MAKAKWSAVYSFNCPTCATELLVKRAPPIRIHRMETKGNCLFVEVLGAANRCASAGLAWTYESNVIANRLRSPDLPEFQTQIWSFHEIRDAHHCKCGAATLVRCGVRNDLQRDQRERKGSKLAFLLQIAIKRLNSDWHC
jgi:hypothetical protein